MSISFGEFDFDNAINNVSLAYRRASQVASEAAAQASQAASELWTGAAESESEAEELPEVSRARKLLAAVASPLLARHIKEHAELFHSVLSSKDAVAAGAGEMLFGRQGDQITRFWLRRKPPHGVEVASGGLDQRPAKEELEEEEEEQQLRAHSGDAWLRILNCNDVASVLDFQVDSAHGCDGRALAQVMALFEAAPRALEVLLLAAFEEPTPRRRVRCSAASKQSKERCGGSRRVRHAVTQLAPSTVAVLRRVVSLKSLQLRVEALPDVDGAVKVLRVDAKVPLDFDTLQKNYNRVGKLLKHYDLLSVKAYDSASDACLYTFLIQDGWIHICFHLMDGQLAWPSEGQRPAMPLEFGDGVKLDVEVQLSVLLMGLNLPSVALPKLFLQLEVLAGKIRVVCQDAGEEEAAPHVHEDWSTQVMSSISSAAWAAAEGAANYAYDFQLLRRLLKEKFSVNLSFESEGSPGDAATMRTAVELAIPKSAAAEMVTQCLGQFLTEQLKKMDLLMLFRDLLDAVSDDMSRLAEEELRPPSDAEKSRSANNFL